MKKAFASALCILALAGSLCGCGGARRLTLRVGASEDSVWQVAANDFQEKLEAYTEGRYSIVLANGGGDRGGNGSWDLELVSVASLREREQGLAVVSLPWLFSDGYESVDSVLLGEGAVLRDAVFALIRNLGVEPLALGENGFFQLTSDRRSLSAPTDLSGLRLTAPFDGPAPDFLRTLGAEVTTQPGEDAFPALRDAALDGQSDTLDAIRADRSYLVQRYMTVWNCSYDPICLTASGTLWGGLSETDREAFRRAAREACAHEVESARAMLSGTLAEFRETGVEVTELDEQQLALFRDQSAPVYEKWRTLLGEELIPGFAAVP